MGVHKGQHALHLDCSQVGEYSWNVEHTAFNALIEEANNLLEQTGVKDFMIGGADTHRKNVAGGKRYAGDGEHFA